MSNSSRRHGNIVGYFGTLASDGQTPVTVSGTAGQFSSPQYIGQDVDQFAMYLSVDPGAGSTTVTLYAAHSSQLTAEGDDSHRGVVPDKAYFYPVQWNTTAVTYTFNAKGTVTYIVPDFVPGWTMLKISSACSIYGGWEGLAR